ncbi:MAG: ArsJ-associated glyceraldehyde-3-phosphate dehydrogenase [Gammaproteobacteria bacterium]|nr:ArsJ-associated glyceraldehyde-3-phosphate dehydrogenase [Gammaproteobacteria bacterium]
MSVRVAINGFGRMGRLALRAAVNHPELRFVAINEPACAAEMSAHLLEFDSVHGRWDRSVESNEHGIVVDGKPIAYSMIDSPMDVPWGNDNVDIVLECSGKFRTAKGLAAFIEHGIQKVIVAAPVKEGALNVVMGINHDRYEPNRHRLLTAASCTTNCLAPVVKVIHEGLGIRHGMMTTIHDVTNTQTVVDAPHRDFRRARSSLMSLIPTTTGSATAISMIYPELAGKLNGVAVRVPLLNASLTDCVFEVERPTSIEEVNELLRNAAKGPLAGILGFEQRPLVSVDYVNDTRSSIVDAPSTMVVDGTQVKILAWYDNEIGYVNRMVELASMVARSLH